MAADGSTALAVREKVQLFLNAACIGNIDLLIKIAKQLDDGKGLSGTVADIKDANKRGALHFAAREGKTKVCKYLLEELKLDVNTRDNDGETPLVHTTRQGHTETAKYLLEFGADPAIASDMGTTALHHSAAIGNVELLRLFLLKGIDVDAQSDSGTPLVWAAGHDQHDAVRVLLEHHANPNAETDDNITPLISAVAAGSLACVELLIETGANVNVIAGGATPLHIAADSGNLEIINCLVKAGADPNIADESYEACRIPAVLLTDIYKESPLENLTRTIGRFMTDDIECDTFVNEGEMPIHVAAGRANRSVVQVLLPLTRPVDKIPDWTVDGILRYMKSEISEMQKSVSNREADDASPVAKVSKEVLQVTPEAKAKAAEAKSRGDEAFKRKDYTVAVDAYTQALDFNPFDAAVLSNRSLCWIRLGQAEQALADAKACRELRPDWPKAFYREGAALRLMERFEEAATCFFEGVQLAPENMELAASFRETVEAGRKFHGTNKNKKS